MKSPIQIVNKKSSPRGLRKGPAVLLIVCVFGLAAVVARAAMVQYRVLRLFSETEAVNISAPLTLGSDGNFYGTAFGGPTGAGDIFKISPSGAFTLLHAFPIGGTPGGGPA